MLQFFQVCSIDMAMGSLDFTTVSLIPDQLVMTQGTDMPIFHITDSNLGPKTFKTGKNGLCMVVVMKRKITSEMMTTYFPSLLLTAITFATTFFKPFFFEAALSVNLTTMLVMTTIFISKMEGLPPTSDIKMIDIWLILCQLVPFAQVVLLTAMEYLREQAQEEKEVEMRKGEEIATRGENQREITVIELEMEDDTVPKQMEAGIQVHAKKAGTSIEQQLLTVGKFPKSKYQVTKFVLFFREEGVALDSTCCIRRIFLRCTWLLF